MFVKRTLMICASVLMLLSVDSFSASASQTNQPHRSVRINRHFNNTKRYVHEKEVHARNLHRINRIKRHLLSHQKNLIKVSKRINRLKRHRYNVNLIKHLNNDKSRLIYAIQNNERGMLRLAKTVVSEEHQINLIRHPQSHRQSTSSGPTVKLPKVTSEPNSSVEHSVMTVINEVNGKLTKYVAKDSTSKQNDNQTSYHQIADVNGHYSATPERITRNEMNQLNQQIQNQIQDSNRWFNEMNQEINDCF